jgi:hypothetical protein
LIESVKERRNPLLGDVLQSKVSLVRRPDNRRTGFAKPRIPSNPVVFLRVLAERTVYGSGRNNLRCKIFGLF